LSIVDKNISWLEIPMSYSLLSQILHPIVKVKYDVAQLLFTDGDFAFYSIFETALVAEFGNYVTVSLRKQCLMELQDVGVVHQLQNSYLFEDECFEMLGFELIQRDEFNGQDFFFVRLDLRVFRLSPL
jgi:hypothetical protein